jgi:tRNA A-37 threonylcarbamoyl transferase component Bud32
VGNHLYKQLLIKSDDYSGVIHILSQSLTKSIEKYSNNYTIQRMHYQHILHGEFNETNLVIVNVIIFFYKLNLVKVGQV